MAESALPALFAFTVPGLEGILATEIEEELGGIVKKQFTGTVVFRLDEIDRRVLRLKTAEDVFLLAWGSDQLTYRNVDLQNIIKWTSKEADWKELFDIHYSVHGKMKGFPSYHLVTQMYGEHGYRRVDAAESLARGLGGKIPKHYKPTTDEAQIEIWMRIQGARAMCGLRLSDSKMRHRTYKTEHVQASLRPVVAAAMLKVANTEPEAIIIDPCCGAGTVLGEFFASQRRGDGSSRKIIGGDIDKNTMVAAWSNMRNRMDEPPIVRWDAKRLPLANDSIDCIITNPPFGKQLSSPKLIGPLYKALVAEFHRVLKPGGKAVIIVSDIEAMQQAAWDQGWSQSTQVRIKLLGYPAAITSWIKN